MDRFFAPRRKCRGTSEGAEISCPGRRGLRGNMVPFPAALCAAGNGMDSGRSIPGAPAVLRGTGRAGKSRAARGAVPHCIFAEMPRLGVQGPIFASSRAVILGAPGAFLLDRSSGPFSFCGKAATAHLGRAASAAFDAGSPCVGRPESIKLKGPPLRCAQWGTKENGPLERSKRERARGPIAAFLRKCSAAPHRGPRAI